MVKHNLKQVGLTLIEVLIALAIISVAMTAVIKATSQNIHSTGYLQKKSIAMYVGQQVINEARAGIFKSGSSGNQKLTTKMLGQEWFWKVAQEETPNNRIKKITVKVYENENDEEDESSIITLESYIYHEE